MLHGEQRWFRSRFNDFIKDPAVFKIGIPGSTFPLPQNVTGNTDEISADSILLAVSINYF